VLDPWSSERCRVSSHPGAARRRQPVPGSSKDQTGLDNSTLPHPIRPDESGYSVINHCRWNRLLDVLPSLIFKRPFHDDVLAHFEANRRARATGGRLVAEVGSPAVFLSRSVKKCGSLIGHESARPYNCAFLVTLNPGERIGWYEILSPVGSGGMGDVYKARDVRLERAVALKVLRGPIGSPDERDRVLREARACATLQHPNICVLHDIGSDGPHDYLVFEFLDGENLAEKIQQGALKPDEVMAFARQIADALRRGPREWNLAWRFEAAQHHGGFRRMQGGRFWLGGQHSRAVERVHDDHAHCRIHGAHWYHPVHGA
jgi:Protein kinase domain